MTELQALQIAYNELSQLMPCEENKDIFEAADVLQKMIHKKKIHQIKQNAKRYQLNDKPHNALGIIKSDMGSSDVLDKIRTDIDEQTEIHSDGKFYIKNIDVKRIIDKHKAESEDKE